MRRRSGSRRPEERKTDPPADLTPAALKYLAIRLGVGVLALGTYWVFSRIISPEDYSQYALIVAAASGISAMLYAWQGIALIRHLPDQRISETVHVSNVVALFAMASVILLLGFVALAATVARPALPSLISGLFLSLLTGWFGLSVQVSQARFDIFAYSIKNLLRFAGLPVLGLVFVWAGSGAPALIVAHALALSLAVGFGIRTDLAGVALAKIDRATIQSCCRTDCRWLWRWPWRGSSTSQIAT